MGSIFEHFDLYRDQLSTLHSPSYESIHNFFSDGMLDTERFLLFEASRIEVVEVSPRYELEYMLCDLRIFDNYRKHLWPLNSDGTFIISEYRDKDNNIEMLCYLRKNIGVPQYPYYRIGVTTDPKALKLYNKVKNREKKNSWRDVGYYG